MIDSVFEEVTNDWVATFEKPENQNGFMWRMAAQDTLPKGVNPNDERVIGLCRAARNALSPTAGECEHGFTSSCPNRCN